MLPKVSVVIDNYNYGRFLGEAIDSVLGQDYPAGRVELWVVDDGSTDDSRKVIERYGDRVKAAFQANAGYAAAFNNGIGRATGDLVCLLDADDVWLPGKLKRVAEAFAAHPEAAAVQHLLQDADAALKPLPATRPDWPPTAGAEDYLAGRLPLAATSALSFRREAVLKALPIPAELRFLYADDYLLVHALFQGAVVNLAESLALHRVHGANFCAGAYSDPGRLAADLRMRGVFEERLKALCERHGKAPSARYRRDQALERLRREVLLHMHEGRRTRAFGVWAAGLARHALSLQGLFRLGTLALALLSPRLYLALYERYVRLRSQ